MEKQKIKESLVYKKDLVLKSASENELEEHEYLFSRTAYNEDGKVISEIQYSPSGDIIQEYEYKYNSQGLLIEELLKEADGFIVEHKSFEVNDEGKIIKEFRHYLDESFDTINYFYDDRGTLIKKEVIDPDGDLESVEEFSYSGELQTAHIVKDADGELVYEKKIDFNDEGKAVEIYEFDGSSGQTKKVVNEYYPSGNKKEVLTYNHADQLIEKVTLKENTEGKIVQVTEESPAKKNISNFTYDERGNMVYQDEFDKNGEMITKVNREYDENNKLLSSTVFMHGAGRGLSRNYTLRQEYVYF